MRKMQFARDEDWLDLTEISPGFFVSRKPRNGQEYDLIRSKGIKTVVSLLGPFGAAEEKRALSRRGIEFKRTQLKAHNFEEFEGVLEMLKPPCLLHCVGGAQSAVFAVGYLMKKGASLERAKKIVEEKFGLSDLFDSEEKILREIMRRRELQRKKNQGRGKRIAQRRRLK